MLRKIFIESRKIPISYVFVQSDHFQMCNNFKKKKISSIVIVFPNLKLVDVGIIFFPAQIILFLAIYIKIIVMLM